MQRQPLKIIGLVLYIIVVVPLSIGIAAACYIGFIKLPTGLAGEFLHIILVVVYFVLLVGLVLGYGLSESHDLSKLFIFPISYERIFVWSVLNDFLPSFLLSCPLLLAIVLGFAQSIGQAVFIIFVGLVFVFQAVAVGQCCGLVLQSFLESRRFRDLLILLVPILCMVFYVPYFYFIRKPDTLGRLAFINLLKAQPGKYLRFIPSGYTAESVINMVAGHPLMVLMYLAGLGVVAVLAVYFTGYIIKGLYYGQWQAPQKVERHEVTGKRSSLKRLIFERLGPESEALFDKELAYFWREPQVKGMLLQPLLLVVIVFLIFYFRGSFKLSSSFILPVMTAVMMLWGEFPHCFNIFGWDGIQANCLFLFPCPRRTILLVKNLTLFLLLGLVNFIVIAAICGFARSLALLPVVFILLQAALLITLGLGNFVSIYFPIRLTWKGWRPSRQSGPKRFFYGFIYMAGMVVILIMSIPMGVALVPLAFKLPMLLMVTVPLAFGYAVWIYYLLLRGAEYKLVQREQGIIGEFEQSRG